MYYLPRRKGVLRKADNSILLSCVTTLPKNGHFEEGKLIFVFTVG